MNKYDVYLDHGRVLALDQDSGDVYRVLVEKDSKLVRVFSSEEPEDCPYEIYVEDGVTILLNTLTASTFKVTLVAYEDQG